MNYHPRFDREIVMKSAEDDDAGSADIVSKALDGFRDEVRGLIADNAKPDTALAGRLDKLEARLNRPAVFTNGDKSEDVERKAFNAFLHGDGGLELKTLNTGTPAAGGVLIPTTLSTTIIQKLTEFSPVRSIASAINIGGALYQFPREVNPVVPASRAELAAVTVSEPTFELIDAKPYEMAVKVPVSRIMFEDSAVSRPT